MGKSYKEHRNPRGEPRSTEMGRDEMPTKRHRNHGQSQKMADGYDLPPMYYGNNGMEM